MMNDLYFSVNLPDDRTLFLATLTDRRLAMAVDEIEDPSGYFLFEQHGTGSMAAINIIARAVSEEAALWLRDMFKMS